MRLRLDLSSLGTATWHFLFRAAMYFGAGV